MAKNKLQEYIVIKYQKQVCDKVDFLHWVCTDPPYIHTSDIHITPLIHYKAALLVML